MNIRPGPLLSSLTLASAFLLINGCSTSAPVVHDMRRVHESRMQQRWRGKPYAELLQSYGPPRLVMTVVNHPVEQEVVVVYGVVDASSPCIDAFLVGPQRGGGELIVADYFCR